MEANELRIGNILRINGNPVIVKGIIGNSIVINENAKHMPFDCFEPIPLTEELLLKAGFEYDEYQYIYELNTVIVHIQNGILTFRKYYLSNKEFEYEEIEIKHLHQLQNLYFALTGKELNIEL